MPRWIVCCLIVPAMCAGATQVEVVGNEVWLVRDGVSKQLTDDGKTKLQAVLSAPGDRIAYYEACPQAEGCIPSVVILDLDGNRLQVFQPRPAAPGWNEPCASILGISWVRADTLIGVECHNTPSSSLFIEFDLTTGKNVLDLDGFGFTFSPDGKLVAHVGGLIHFAPPYAQSNYLLFNNTIVYPLGKRTKPIVRKPLDTPPDVVREKGPSHIGIHDIVPRFVWSRSSARVAFIDCVFDWVETGEISPGGGNPIGDETNRRCSVAAVSQDGSFKLFPLRDVPLESIYASRLSWIDDGRIQLEFSATIPGRTLQQRAFKIQ
jgi:hypothetical protein